MKLSPHDMEMIISLGARISYQGEYPLSRQQKCVVAQDQHARVLASALIT